MILVGLICGTLSLTVFNGFRDQKLTQQQQNQCWVADGEWKDGSCYHMPSPIPTVDEDFYCVERDDDLYLYCRTDRQEFRVLKSKVTEFLDWRKNNG